MCESKHVSGTLLHCHFEWENYDHIPICARRDENILYTLVINLIKFGKFFWKGGDETISSEKVTIDSQSYINPNNCFADKMIDHELSCASLSNHDPISVG